MSELQYKTTQSLKWSAIERLASQAIQLIVMLTLGRMLGPVAFGLIGMLTVFIAISQTLVDSGFSSALIRKTDRSEKDFATVFYFNIFVSVVCYLLLFFSAPFIADFYKEPILISLVRVLGLTIIINSLAIIQRTKLTVLMDFKTQAKASLISVVISATIALLCAKYDFGVWSLVAQVISVAFFNVVLLNLFHRWCPKTGFSIASFKNLFGFGSKLLLSSLLNTLYNNIYQVIIGKFFAPSQLGLFTQANNLSSIPATTFSTIIQRVTYPMMSHIQDDNSALDKAYLLTLRLSAVVVFPIIAGLGVIAYPLIDSILGAQWLPAAPLLSLLCLGYMLYPIHSINLNLLQVKGRSDLFLKLEIIKKILITLLLLITIPLGVVAICIGITIQSYLSLIINTHYTGRLTSLTLGKQVRALLPIWLLTCLALGVSCVPIFIIENSYLQLLTAICTAGVIYILLIKYYQNDLYRYLLRAFLGK